MAILRYTIGPVPPIGFQILRESVKLMRRIYPELTITICHNQLNPKQVDFLKRLEVYLHEQKHEILYCAPTVENWKLYPPRIDINQHELVIDNDVIFEKRIKQIDEFLTSNKPVVMSAVHRAYGQFEEFVNKETYVNCGIYGMPPGFDFEAKIKEFCWIKGTTSWSPRFDDQGLVAAALTSSDHIMIPMDEILPLGEGSDFREGNGYHFISSNRDGYHTAWDGYKKNKLPIFL